MMLSELHSILQATGYPVAYSHFIESTNSPLPDPPFICYLVVYSSHFSADNVIYKSIENIQIELYTNTKNLDAETIVENVLNENELPFGTTETFIDSEQLYQKIYEVRLF